MKIIYAFWILFVSCTICFGAEYNLYDWITEEDQIDIRAFDEATACEGHSQLVNNESVIIESPGYPGPYPTNHDNNSCNAWFWNITTSGYNVDIIMDKFNVCAVCNDFLIISPGVSLQKDTSAIFTGSLSQYQQVQVLEHSSVYMLFITQNRTYNDYEGFRLTVEGNGTITTETPTMMPPPTSTLPSDLLTDITVYLSGKHPEDFLVKISSFQAAVADMANNYCEIKSIQLSSKVTYSNVQIFLVQQCPMTWPNWDICITVTMAVQVDLANNLNNTYELTPAHLQEMWDIFAKNNSIMISLGLKVYETPKENQALFLWLSISLGIVVTFMVILFAGWMLVMHIHNRASELNMKDGTKRVSIESADSWVSSNYQQLPPLTDLYQDIDSNDTLQPPTFVAQQPRTSDGEFGGALRFSISKGYENNAYDNADEVIHRIPKSQNRVNYFSPDEKNDKNNTIDRINNDYLYEDPKAGEENERESVM